MYLENIHCGFYAIICYHVISRATRAIIVSLCVICFANKISHTDLKEHIGTRLGNNIYYYCRRRRNGPPYENIAFGRGKKTDRRYRKYKKKHKI